jgi:hypothetical protein
VRNKGDKRITKREERGQQKKKGKRGKRKKKGGEKNRRKGSGQTRERKGERGRRKQKTRSSEKNSLLSFNTTLTAWKTKQLGGIHRHTDS